MNLWEEAEKIFFLGVEVYAFGLYCALGAAAALIMLLLQCRREGLKQGTAALTGMLSLALGFVCSRLLYCLLDQSLGLEGVMPLSGMLLVTGGGYSMVGALLGGVLGALLAGKLSGQSSLYLADLMVPCLMLFAACERLGEGYVLDFGISRPLLGDLLKGSFLAVEGDYDWYLATYLLESFAALVLSVVLLRDAVQQHKDQRAGKTLLLFLILYGGVQTMLESLRYDRHMSISFVGLQHVMAMAMLGLTVLYLALRMRKINFRLSLAAIISVPVTLGLGLALEFAIDRNEISRYLLYGVYAVVLALPLYLAKMHKMLIAVPAVLAAGLALRLLIGGPAIDRYVLYLAYAMLLAVPMYLGVRLRKEDIPVGKTAD